jgi:large subunit ribosomal protein L3
MPPRIPRQLWARAHPLRLQPLPLSPIAQQTRNLRSILKPPRRPSRYNAKKQPTALSAAAAHARKAYTTPQRAGLLATKKGMSAIFEPTTGERIPCTVLQVDRCQVIAHKTAPIHGYWAVVMGSGARKPKRLSFAILGHFAAQGVPPKEKVMEFKVKGEEGLLPVGTVLEPSWFREGQLVDTRSKTKGKGFAGVSCSRFAARRSNRN